LPEIFAQMQVMLRVRNYLLRVPEPQCRFALPQPDFLPVPHQVMHSELRCPALQHLKVLLLVRVACVQPPQLLPEQRLGLQDLAQAQQKDYFQRPQAAA
jgi:hypothetical protein